MKDNQYSGNDKTKQVSADSPEQLYRLAKLMRSASREIARQFNTKKTRKQR